LLEFLYNVMQRPVGHL